MTKLDVDKLQRTYRDEKAINIGKNVLQYFVNQDLNIKFFCIFEYRSDKHNPYKNDPLSDEIHIFLQ